MTYDLGEADRMSVNIGVMTIAVAGLVTRTATVTGSRSLLSGTGP
jgi:hypothetical protein